MLRSRVLAISIAHLAIAISANAQSRNIGSSPEKSKYTLFNPTPRSLWRPLSADRPDITESPTTVDAGVFQLEMSFVDYATDSDLDAWTVAPLNLKVGLTNDVDLQFVANPWVSIEGDDETGDESGFGDIQFRLKWNLWGNDGGKTALALMPYVKIPTAEDGLGNDEFEGGVIVPFALRLTEALDVGLMAEVDFVYDGADGEYDVEFVHTAVLGIGLTDELGWYVEGVGIVSSDPQTDYRALLGSGLTYALTEDLVFDVGANVGLTGETDDVNVFTGVTIRF